MNKVLLIGNLGNKIQIKTFDNGGVVGNVSLATSENYTDKEGQKQTKTEWHKLVFYNKLAEIIEKYTNKGTKLFVEGKLRTREWQTSENEKRYSTEIIVTNFEFLSAKGTTETTPAQTQTETKETEDDLPF